MTDRNCIACRTTRAPLDCGICKEPLCKACDQLKYTALETLPSEIKAVHACSVCFNGVIEPAVAAQSELVEKARAVLIFTTNQRAPLPITKRAKDRIFVPEGDDKDGVTLALAVQAARMGYNAIIDSEIVSKKVRNEGYQKMSWSAEGRPAQVDAERLLRHESAD